MLVAELLQSQPFFPTHTVGNQPKLVRRELQQALNCQPEVMDHTGNENDVECKIHWIDFCFLRGLVFSIVGHICSVAMCLDRSFFTIGVRDTWHPLSPQTASESAGAVCSQIGKQQN